ncbi:unnamed protein product [Pylaiella littoralis]
MEGERISGEASSSSLARCHRTRRTRGGKRRYQRGKATAATATTATTATAAALTREGKAARRHPRAINTPPPTLPSPTPSSWSALAAVAAAVVLLSASVADAGSSSYGASGGSGSGSGGSRSVPWWYPSRGWGMLPSDGEEGGAAGAAAVGGGGWPGLEFPLRRYSREEAKLAGEAVQNWVAYGFAEKEEEGGKEGDEAVVMPVCHACEAGNDTLRKLGASLDRCASPYYSLPEIHPSQLVYTEVDPAVEAANKLREQRQEANRRSREKKREADAEGRRGLAGSGRGVEGGEYQQDEEEVERKEDSFLGIFLFLKGDFFSVELENALTSVRSAYPRAWVVKADAPSFLSFCVQYDLHTFPQLLLFRNGHLMSRYRGKRSPGGLAAWFSLMTGDLPRAVPRRPLPPPPPPHPLSPPGLDEPLTWLALMYAAAKIATAVSWFVKRRRRGGGGVGGADGQQGAGGRRGAAAAVGRWVARSRLWLARVLYGRGRVGGAGAGTGLGAGEGGSRPRAAATGNNAGGATGSATSGDAAVLRRGAVPGDRPVGEQ